MLVTGAAGFIGFHISKQLVQGWGVGKVVGLDSFNDYYDVQLKKDRASYLLQLGVEVISVHKSVFVTEYWQVVGVQRGCV